MRKRLYFLSVALFCLLVACENSLDKQYHEKTAQEDMKSLLEEDSVSAKLVFSAVIKRKMEGKSAEGITFEQLASEGKKLGQDFGQLP